MERGDVARGGVRGLHAQVVRLLHSREATWWFRLLARTALAQIASFIAAAIIIGAITPDADADAGFDLAVLLSISCSVVVGLYFYRTLGDARAGVMARSKWRGDARTVGFLVALGVWWLSFFSAGVVSFLLEVASVPEWLGGILWSLMFVLGLWLARHAYIARRDLELELLEKAQPPELRVAIDLTRLAEGFRERAQALEEAMRDATAISEQVQLGIERSQQQFNELQRQYLRQFRLSELTPEQETAIAELLSDQQAGSERRARRSNVVIAFVFYVLGVATPLFVPNAVRDQLQEQLRQWLHLA